MRLEDRSSTSAWLHVHAARIDDAATGSAGPVFGHEPSRAGQMFTTVQCVEQLTVSVAARDQPWSPVRLAAAAQDGRFEGGEEGEGRPAGSDASLSRLGSRSETAWASCVSLAAVAGTRQSVGAVPLR